MLFFSIFVLCLASSGEGFAFPSLSTNTRSRSGHCEKSQVKVSSTVGAGADSTQSVKDDYAGNVQNTYGRYPLAIAHGKGTRLTDLDGKEYLDFAAGIATCALGHSNEKLKTALVRQLDKVQHVSNLYFIPEQAALAKWLVTNSCADKAFFCNSGAEANEAAIKLARKYANTKLGIEHPVIITALNSFHGRTLTAITATGQPKYQAHFGPLTPGFEYVPYNDAARLREMVAQLQEESKQGSGRGLAAIMMEPLQGEGGIRPGTAEFFETVRALCDETGALMVCDEVQTGMGRTGTLWAHEHFGPAVQPDVFTSAKALGGGVPIGAMCCKDKCDVFAPGDHASTYGGNPLACAAGLTVAAAFDEDGLLENVQARSAQFHQAAAALQAKYPALIQEVRGWGLINGIELKESSGLTASTVTQALMEAGLLVVPAGPQVVRFVPPLVVTEADVTAAMQMLEAALVKLSSTAGAGSS